MNQVVSFSGGKDSTAMLLMMLERGEDVHSVVFFDTGWEFPQMHEHIAKVEEFTGVDVVKLKPKKAFDDYLINPKYKWPDAIRRWCTRFKINAVKSYAKKNDSIECIGYAADEWKRAEGKEINKRPTRFPLIEWEITEPIALQYCIDRGFDWGGLYNHFPRVSCYCCPLQSLGELKRLRKYYPEHWASMLNMETIMPENGGFNGYKTVHDLEARFAEEDRQIKLPGME